MAKSNVYIKSGVWKKTDKPVKGELSLDSVVDTIISSGIPASSPVFEYNATGGSVSRMQVSYAITTDQYTNGGSGNVSIQSHYVSSFHIYNDLTATSLTFYTDYVDAADINYSGDNNSIKNLITLNFPNLLKQLGGNGFVNIGYLPQLTTVLSPLITAGTIGIEYCDNLDTVDVSSMVNGKGYLRLSNCPLITLSSITRSPEFSAIDFTSCSGLGSSISISATDIYTSFGNCDTLISISFPNAVYYNGFGAQSCDNLTNISLGSIGTIKNVNGGFSFYNSALNSTSITHVLDVLISLDGTNGTTLWGPDGQLDISGGTNAIPSAEDLVKIGILEGRGASVNYNS
jgi:hypothetical protein